MSLIVKICGLSTAEALDVALDAGADMVGFVFFPPSPRNVSFDTARELGLRVANQAAKVALTVDADDLMFDAIVRSLKPDLLQLHGQETPTRVDEIKHRYGLPVIKAVTVEARSDFPLIKEYAAAGDWILFDAKAPVDATRPGGLGRPADWPMVNELRPELGWEPTINVGKPFDWVQVSAAISGVPVILSGGLNAENVKEALRITRVPAVDVSSGVESSPGVKDVEKIREFIRVARQAHVHLPPYEVVSNP
jgi:phosphoribosylanthranilate isomerase